MKIIYLRHKEIDKEKWNTAVDQAANGQIYAYTWYLDCVTKKWDALVAEDYAYIMPLPWNAKWLGVKQIYQPYFVQQLGIFGREKPNMETVYAFLKAIPKDFRYVYMHLNEGNELSNLGDFEIKDRLNMLLDMSDSYENISGNFRKSLRRRIRQGKKELHFAVNKVNPKELVAYYQEYLQGKVSLPLSAYATILKIMETALTLDKGNIYSAHFKDGAFAAGIFFAESHQRIVQLFGPSSPAGKNVSAAHFLLNSIIEYHAESNKILDFEGSEIKSIADFFRGFSPREVTYHQITVDKFPFWIKRLRQLKK